MVYSISKDVVCKDDFFLKPSKRFLKLSNERN